MKPSNQAVRRVVLLSRTSAIEGHDLDRLINLLSTGLERYLSKQSAQDGVVDFTAEQSVTTLHENDDMIEEPQWR